MSFPGSLTVTGTLLGFKLPPEANWINIPEVSQDRTGVRGWHKVVLTSNEPLLGEIGISTDSYKYYFLLRESGEHWLLVASSSILIDSLLEKSGVKAHAYCPVVEVAGLVNDLVESPTAYVMSAVHARVQGYGQSLRTVALYGSDVGDARLFRNMLEGLQAYRVTLRKVETGSEVVSIGSRGEVSFHYDGSKSLREVDSALRFLAVGSYIDWERHLSLVNR